MPKNTDHQNGSDHGVRIRWALSDFGGRDVLEPVSKSLAAQRVVKVTFGVPLKGHTPPESYHDRMLMYRYLGAREVEQYYLKENPRYVFNYCNVGEIFVPYAREQLADSAMALDSDYLFMVDDDMLCEPDLFYELAKHDKDVVAALAFTRNSPYQPVLYQVIDGYDPVVQKSYYTNTCIKNYPRNTLVECDAVGFGAVLIKTSVLKKLQKPWFMGSHGAGEDIHFCWMAKKAGFHVYMDTSQKMGHLSHRNIITEEFSDDFNKMTVDQKDFFFGKYQKYSALDRNK